MFNGSNGGYSLADIAAATGANGNMNGDSRTTSPSNGTTRNYQDRMMPYYEYPMEMLRDEREE